MIWLWRTCEGMRLRTRFRVGQVTAEDRAEADRLYAEGVAYARDWQRDERRHWAEGAR